MASMTPSGRPLRVLLASTVLALTLLSLGQDRNAAAHIPHPGVDFAIGIDTNGDTVDDCNSSIGPMKCSVVDGATFDVKFYLNSIGDLAGWEGYDAYLTYIGVSSKDNPDPAAWPDCFFELYAPVEAGRVAWGCHINVLTPPSAYTGMVATTQFNCSEDGSVTMIMGYSFTEIVLNVVLHSEAEAQETLEVNCVASPPVGGVSVDPVVEPSLRAASESNSGTITDAWLIGMSILGALAVIVIAALARPRFTR